MQVLQTGTRQVSPRQGRAYDAPSAHAWRSRPEHMHYKEPGDRTFYMLPLRCATRERQEWHVLHTAGA